MNSEEKFEWDEEDKRFQEEFLEISQLHTDHKSKPPAVPTKLSKLIRKQAAFVKQDDLLKNWILSPAMMLVLVILILFSMGFLFSMSASSHIESNSSLHSSLHSSLRSSLHSSLHSVSNGKSKEHVRHLRP